MAELPHTRLTVEAAGVCEPTGNPEMQRLRSNTERNKYKQPGSAYRPETLKCRDCAVAQRNK
jgi:hypothetical protein